MLIPRRVKHRKQHHPGRSGQATGGTTVTFGEYGIQAITSSPAEWCFITSEAGLSPLSRRMVFGFQNFITSTITAMQVNELTMSVSSGPTKFDTKNCMLANETPHAMIAGSTSSAPFHPVITTMR